MSNRVLILDFGSQFTQLIARRIRELGYYSEVFPGNLPLKEVEGFDPKAIVLSGGPFSVFDPEAPSLSQGFWNLREQKQWPVLGICYGMQLMAHQLGGKVHSASVREYGRARIHCKASPLFDRWVQVLGNSDPTVWMSHGDEVDQIPKGFEVVAESENGSPAAIQNSKDRIFGVQFHPEVVHSLHGIEVLRGFLADIAMLEADWKMESVLEDQVQRIQKQVGPSAQVLCALSGGVDSAVAALLVHRAVGDRLHCVFVDHGMLRWQERERVVELFQKHLKLPVDVIDASDRFLSELDGVVDPEKKRKIIGRLFIEVFEEHSQKLASKLGSLPTFLVQGTLYPDVIESSPPPSQGAKKFSSTIKSHHNVGGLPEKMRLALVEPLRDLFKDEVRALGKLLGAPDAFLKRHPFPGPGLAVRVLGAIRKPHLDLLRKADEVFISSLREAGLYDKIWQAFAVLLPIQTVGVQGDGRSYDQVLALRAVTSSDGMTADWYPFPPEFLAEVSSAICNQVPGISRVVYDVTSKPPATIEWE